MLLGMDDADGLPSLPGVLGWSVVLTGGGSEAIHGRRCEGGSSRFFWPPRPASIAPLLCCLLHPGRSVLRGRSRQRHGNKMAPVKAERADDVYRLGAALVDLDRPSPIHSE